jgi:hypothetical protein
MVWCVSPLEQVLEGRPSHVWHGQFQTEIDRRLSQNYVKPRRCILLAVFGKGIDHLSAGLGDQSKMQGAKYFRSFDERIYGGHWILNDKSLNDFYFSKSFLDYEILIKYVNECCKSYEKKVPCLLLTVRLKNYKTNINITQTFKRTTRKYIYIYMCISRWCMYNVIYGEPYTITGKSNIRIYCEKRNRRKRNITFLLSTSLRDQLEQSFITGISL